MSDLKKPLGKNVLDAARERIAWTFDTFPRIYVSFSAGKDSTVMLHLVMDEALRRNRKVGVLLVDLEGQYQATIAHARQCFQMYAPLTDPYWVCLPIALRNAVSQFDPRWICWDPAARDLWIRDLPPEAINDTTYFPFFHSGMEFEEFVPEFGKWFGQDDLCACFVGIRADESLNRFRTLMMSKSCFGGRRWTTWCGGGLYNIYPIYDWRTEDIWTYHGVFPTKPHNRLYDLMHQAGLTPHQMRICQPYGDDQRKGLWLFHVIEPDTWGRVVARVNGANSGALYAQESGNVLGRLKITKPEGHTWESFAELLLDSMPSGSQEHYRNKIAQFLNWWISRGYQQGIPDEADPDQEEARKAPSWRRVCKALLRHDYWCKGLSFSQTKSESYERYVRVMKARRQKWGIFA